MLGEPARERLFQAIGLATHRPTSQLGKRLRIPSPVDQRGHHVPPDIPKTSLTTTDTVDHHILEELSTRCFRPAGDQVHPVNKTPGGTGLDDLVQNVIGMRVARTYPVEGFTR